MINEGDLFALLNPLTAFVAGAVASLHCVGMCGPLSCSLIGKGVGQKQVVSHSLYHLGRLLSYGGLGSIAGLLGANLVNWLGDSPGRLAPWAFALFFIALAFNLDGRLTRWMSAQGLGRKFVQRAYRTSGHTRGLALGVVTPLIPCGPLYLMLWVTTMSGSALDGAIVMAAFSLGTAPLLLLAQSGWGWLSARLKPNTLLQVRRGLALVAVALVCMRAFLDTNINSLLAGDVLCR